MKLALAHAVGSYTQRTNICATMLGDEAFDHDCRGHLLRRKLGVAFWLSLLAPKRSSRPDILYERNQDGTPPRNQSCALACRPPHGRDRGMPNLSQEFAGLECGDLVCEGHFVGSLPQDDGSSKTLLLVRARSKGSGYYHNGCALVAEVSAASILMVMRDGRKLSTLRIWISEVNHLVEDRIA